MLYNNEEIQKGFTVMEAIWLRSKESSHDETGVIPSSMDYGADQLVRWD